MALQAALTTDPASFASIRVLFFPEILDIIFSFLDPRSNANNARVCRQWSEVALDTLWYEVYGLHKLFALLAPLRKRRNESVRAHSRPIICVTNGLVRWSNSHGFLVLQIGSVSTNIRGEFVGCLSFKITSLYTQASSMMLVGPGRR